MARERDKPKEIVVKLQEVDVLTYYRWCQEVGGLSGVGPRAG